MDAAEVETTPRHFHSPANEQPCLNHSSEPQGDEKEGEHITSCIK